MMHEMEDHANVWIYKPNRGEAFLHILAWIMFVLSLTAVLLGSSFYVKPLGLGWICLLLMEHTAWRRLGIPWARSADGYAWGRRWRIHSYAMRPWKVRQSLRFLKIEC